MTMTAIARLENLRDREPAYALVGEVDLVVVRYDDQVSVFYGRCLHRGALMSDGHVDGHNLICGVHGWDYRLDTGVSEYANDEALPKFRSEIRDGEVLVDEEQIREWTKAHPQPYDRGAYLGLYADPSHGVSEEAETGYIQALARDGLSKTGHHGPSAAMGVPRGELPCWDDIQILTAQLHAAPLLDDAAVGSDVVFGPNAQKPLRLEIPLFVSDMSFGALSEPAKVALARGAEWSGSGVCSGEGGMLPEGQAENSRYFYELASGRFGFSFEKLAKVQALPFQGRPSRQDRHRRASAGRESARQNRRSARGWSLEPPRSRRHGFLNGRTFRDQSLRGRGAQPHRRHPDRLQAVSPAYREGYRRRDGGGRRLHHPRRPRRRHRGRAGDLSGTIFRCRLFRHWPARDAISTGSGPLRCVAGNHRRLAQTPADFVKALALGADAIGIVQRGHAGDWLSLPCAPVTPTIARSASRRKSRIWSAASSWTSPRRSCATFSQRRSIL